MVVRCWCMIPIVIPVAEMELEIPKVSAVVLAVASVGGYFPGKKRLTERGAGDVAAK